MYRGDELAKDITIGKIDGWAGSSETVDKAVALYEQGKVKEIVSTPRQVTALVQGSNNETYTVVLGTNGGKTADCTCPNLRYGDCKHISAVWYALLRMKETGVEPDSYRRQIKYSHMAESVMEDHPNVPLDLKTTANGVPMVHILWAAKHLIAEEMQDYLLAVKDKPDRFPPSYVNFEMRKQRERTSNEPSKGVFQHLGELLRNIL
jgi:hypothetical protein